MPSDWSGNGNWTISRKPPMSKAVVEQKKKAPKERENKAHGASRGSLPSDEKAPKGREKLPYDQQHYDYQHGVGQGPVTVPTFLTSSGLRSDPNTLILTRSPTCSSTRVESGTVLGPVELKRDAFRSIRFGIPKSGLF